MWYLTSIILFLDGRQNKENGFFWKHLGQLVCDIQCQKSLEGPASEQTSVSCSLTSTYALVKPATPTHTHCTHTHKCICTKFTHSHTILLSFYYTHLSSFELNVHPNFSSLPFLLLEIGCSPGWLGIHYLPGPPEIINSSLKQIYLSVPNLLQCENWAVKKLIPSIPGVQISA